MTLEEAVRQRINFRKSEERVKQQRLAERNATRTAEIKSRIDFYLGKLGITGEYGDLPIKIDVLLATIDPTEGRDRIIFPVRISVYGRRLTIQMRVVEYGSFNSEGVYVWSEPQGLEIMGTRFNLADSELAFNRFASIVASHVIESGETQEAEDQKKRG